VAKTSKLVSVFVDEGESDTSNKKEVIVVEGRDTYTVIRTVYGAWLYTCMY
jgi:5S rRNA maturation endonuclease (ribonuclease M5)